MNRSSSYLVLQTQKSFIIVNRLLFFLFFLFLQLNSVRPFGGSTTTGHDWRRPRTRNGNGRRGFLVGGGLLCLGGWWQWWNNSRGGSILRSSGGGDGDELSYVLHTFSSIFALFSLWTKSFTCHHYKHCFSCAVRTCILPLHPPAVTRMSRITRAVTPCDIHHHTQSI